MTDARSLAYAKRRERTRLAIVAAGIDVFREKGYDGATAEEIAGRAGCSRAAFYLHFESKSTMMIAALNLAWKDQDSISESFRANLHAGADRGELSAILAASVRNQTFPVAALHQATLSDPIVAEWYFEEQERALGILLGSRDAIKDPRFARLRARFHILGRMTLDAMNAGPSQAWPTSTDEASEYIGELWAGLLFEIAVSRPPQA